MYRSHFIIHSFILLKLFLFQLHLFVCSAFLNVPCNTNKSATTPRHKVCMYPVKKRRDSRNGNYMPRGGDAWPVQLRQEMAARLTFVSSDWDTKPHYLCYSAGIIRILATAFCKNDFTVDVFLQPVANLSFDTENNSATS
jgi:hypothetical protein